MLEYLKDDNVTCGRILRHEASGSDKANRIWTYRNDLGEEYLAGAKSECRRKALYDLRLCRVDLIVEHTASGGIHRFDYSDTFQQQNINDLADRLKRARFREERYKQLFEQACKERDSFKIKLETIEKFISKHDE
tara:strand:- start:29 stop:433 length:405 start_codon:yes stop_codon:yes gene_type:complete